MPELRLVKTGRCEQCGKEISHNELNEMGGWCFDCRTADSGNAWHTPTCNCETCLNELQIGLLEWSGKLDPGQ